MDERALRILEFGNVKDQIRSYAACSLGKQVLDELGPCDSLEAADSELTAVDESLRFLFRRGTLPFGGVTDIRPYVKKAAIGGVLRADELNDIAIFIHAGRRIRQTVESVDDDLSIPTLTQVVAELFDARQTELEIRQAIDEDGLVVDSASPELRRIRSSRRQAESKVRQILEQMLRTHQKYLQDPVIAMRGDSLCLPVRVDYKSFVPGIVHDYSSSGATVFVEPQAAVEANGRVRELSVEEEREVERVLQRISGMVAGVAEELSDNAGKLALLDAWSAKAQYAKVGQCERPMLREDGYWRLKRARHPLLERNTAVPIDLELGDPHRMIVITGPNTGGKTVTLKTVGLITLMAMSGCFVPTGEGTEIGWCSQMFVDIGDEQSIEQSLSTFSSHMKNIVQMLDRVDGNSLVLLDELGAGTDPTEGANLAMAILDDLCKCGCRVVATTHYAELKAYAFNEPAAVNASVEFNVEDLRPTYRLLVGVPGRSNALAIATRLGLPSRIVEAARAAIKTDDARVEDLIAQMESARRQMEAARDEAVRQRDEVRVKAEALDRDRQKWEDQEERIRSQAESEARALLENAQKEANRVIQELRSKQSAVVKDHELVDLRKSLEKAMPASRTKRRRGSTEHADEILMGSIVRVTSWGQKGEVVEVSPDGKEISVQLGLLRTKVGVTDVELLERKPTTGNTSSGAKRGLPKDISLQLDVRGETVEDAIAATDKYLDNAVLNGLAKVTIIHGKGTGALRDGLRRYLAKHKQVRSYAPGGANEGGDGATVVQLQV